MDRHRRTIIKSLTWRAIATLTTLILVYIFTRNIPISAGISVAEIATKTIIYYLHERMWNKINFGRKN